MRKLSIIFTIILAIGFVACKHENVSNTCEIKGTVEADSLNGKFVIFFSDADKMDSIIAKTKIVDNKFYFKDKILAPPYAAALVVGEEDNTLLRPYHGSTVIIEPGVINMEIQKNRITKVHGTPLNDMFHASEQATITYNELVSKLIDMNISKDEKIAKLMDYKKQRAETIYQALVKHPNCNIANEVLNITYQYLYPSQLDEILTRTKSQTRNKSEFILIKNSINSAIGKQFLDITLPNLKGDSISLSDEIKKSEYTLLKFWASWCGPCIRTIPDMQKAYNASSRKALNIVAISLDTNHDEWEEAYNKYMEDWTSMSSLKAWKCPSAELYGITVIPASLLIDKNGTIVAKDPSYNELKIFLDIKE